MLLTPLYGNFNPKVKPKLFWKQFLFIKKKNYYYYKILFFGIFLFILVYPLHRTWPFILSFCFKFPFSCIRASFYTPEQFSLNCSFAFLWPHALASPAVFPSIVPLPKSFHKPSFFSLSIYVRAFSDHMSCFCVSKIDRLCNICTPSTSYVEKGKVCGTLQGLKFSDSSEIEIEFDDRYSLPRRSGQSWKSFFLSRL